MSQGYLATVSGGKRMVFGFTEDRRLREVLLGRRTQLRTTRDRRDDRKTNGHGGWGGGGVEGSWWVPLRRSDGVSEDGEIGGTGAVDLRPETREPETEGSNTYERGVLPR